MFCNNTNSPTPYSKLDSYAQKQELEKQFCRDFACCGLHLDNLHELLEHYEEYHPLHNSYGISSINNNNTTKDTNNNNSNSSSCSISSVSEDEEGSIIFDCIQPSSPKRLRLTTVDPNMLENSQQKYVAPVEYEVQTMDTIVDSQSIPTLSPCDNNSNSMDPSSDTTTITAVQQINKATSDDLVDRPYRCSVESCDKAYKNANGLKYHRLHGHCSPTENGDALDASRPYLCRFGSCKKRYKNLNGLKYHMEHTHMIKVSDVTSDMFLKFEASSSSAPSPQPFPSTSITRGMKRKVSSGPSS